MTQTEFEILAGYEVTQADYNTIIEPMYMATVLSKEEFVKCINKARFALPTRNQMLNTMRRLAKILKENCTHFIDKETETALRELVTRYIDRFYHGACNNRIDKEMLWSCYYPACVVIYDKKTFRTVETIKLI